MPASRSELVPGSDLGAHIVGWPLTRLSRMLTLLGIVAGAWFLALLFHSGSAAAAPAGAGISPPTAPVHVAVQPVTARVAVAVQPPSVRIAVRPRFVPAVVAPAVRPSSPRPSGSRPSGSQRPSFASGASGFASTTSRQSTSPVSSAASWLPGASTGAAAAARSRVAPTAASLTPARVVHPVPVVRSVRAAVPVAAAALNSATQAVAQPSMPGVIATVTGFAAPLQSIAALAGSAGLTLAVRGVVAVSVPVASGLLDAASVPATGLFRLASPGRTDTPTAWPASRLDAPGWAALPLAAALAGTLAGNAAALAAVPATAPSLAAVILAAAPALPGPAAPSPVPTAPDAVGSASGQQSATTAFGAAALVWAARRRAVNFLARRGHAMARAPRQRATQPPVSPD
jgi:hypothetical protein